MPTYEYVCTKCGHRVEAIQSMRDASLKTCGVCGGELRKVFYPTGVVFKGSGFYSTDSRAKQKTGADTSSKKEDSSSDTKASGEKSTSGADASKSSSSSDSSSSSPSSDSSSSSSSSSGESPSSSKGSKAKESSKETKE